jgi:hypothetical protein
MRLVDKPRLRPMCCAAVPFIGQTADCRWIDTGNDLGFDNDRVYLSEPAVQDAAKLLGYPTVEEHAEAVAELSRALARVEDLETELKEANQYLDSIDVLASRDFVARKKPGRPKKEPVG